MQRVSEYTRMERSYTLLQEYIDVQLNLVPRALFTVQNSVCHFKLVEKAPGDEVEVQFGKIPGKIKFVRLLLNVFVSGLTIWLG